MLNNKKISIVFPCKNEEKIIEKIIPHLPSFIDEVIVVDNLSSDNTFQIAKKLKAKTYKEKRHINGIGYGYAIQTGISKAHGDYIIIMDGDKTYPLHKLKHIFQYMKLNNYDFISCNRFPFQHFNDMSMVRFIGGMSLSLFTNLLFNTHIKDILSGMWIFSKDSIPYLNLQPGDWNLSLSIKISAATSPYVLFSEYHIPYHDRKIGYSKQSLIKTGLLHLIFLCKLKYNNMMKYVYKFRKVYG